MAIMTHYVNKVDYLAKAWLGFIDQCYNLSIVISETSDLII